jgi:LAGLIDADG DNA endonuclease family
MFMENSLGQVDLPDCTVSEESNSNPLENAWVLYDKLVRNDLVGFSRVISYAGRGSYKTLSAAVLEVMALLHTPRNVGHMAAISTQSQYAANYVKDFFRAEILRDFVVEENATGIRVVRFIHKTTGEVLTLKEFSDKGLSEVEYERFDNFLKLIICTMAGANSTHVEFFCVDGDTKILTRHTGSDARRKRKGKTARSLYRAVAGLPLSGHPTEPTSVEVPANIIEVLSYNWTTGAIEFQPIAGAVKRESDCIELSKEDGSPLVCSSEHLVWTRGGFTEAKNIKVGDEVVTINKTKTLSGRCGGVEVSRPDAVNSSPVVKEFDLWEQVVLGSLLGDCGIYKKKFNNPYLREQHCEEQRNYLDWKRKVISQKIRTHETVGRSGFTGISMPAYQSGCSPLLLKYQHVRTTLEGAEGLEAPGLAIWYQDDGCAGNGFRLSTEGFSLEQNLLLVEILKRNFDISAEVSSYERNGSTYFYIRGGVEAKRRMVEMCQDWIHPDMAYKFDLTSNTGRCVHCGEPFWYYERSRNSVTCGGAMCRHLQSGTLSYSKIMAVRHVGIRAVYDFVVQGNHNFWSNGFLSKNCVDEVDVVPSQHIAAYYQAQNIPDPRAGLLPLTILTSTRKYRTGLVQKELDEAARTGLHVRHWNVIDVTQACSPDRHHPEFPKQKYYINDDLIKHITAEEYAVMNPGQQKPWQEAEGFEGCRGCKLFPACKSRLATHQTCSSRLLKPVSWVLEKFQNAPTPEFIATEYLCRRAESTGLVYSRINKDKHLKSASEISELVTGEVPTGDFGKSNLIALLKTRGAVFFTGMDFGFSHNFAATTFAIFGRYVFVLDCYAQAGLELDEQTANCEYLKTVYDNPVIYADMAYPGSVKTFRTRGFKARDWEKKPFSVKAGIEIVRSLLLSGSGITRLIFLKGDSGVELLFKRMENYKYKVDASGTPTEEPEDKDDDEVDSLRYGIMNALGTEGAIKEKKSTVVTEAKKLAADATPDQKRVVSGPHVQNQWMIEEIRALTGQPVGVGDSSVNPNDGSSTVRKGRFVWSQ